MGLIKLLAWTAGFAIATFGLIAGVIALTYNVPVGIAVILVSLAIAQKLF